MNPVRALRRLLANTDRVAPEMERVREAVDNVTDNLNDKMDRLQQGVDNLASGLNSRLDRLVKAAAGGSSDANEGMDRLQQGVDNLASGLNSRLDRLVEAATGGSSDANEKTKARDVTTSNRPVAGVSGAARTGPSAKPVASDAGPDKVRASRARPVAEWLNGPSPEALPLPRWSGKTGKPSSGTRASQPTNALKTYQPLLDGLEPWRGPVPKGFLVDFLGILTDANFRTLFGVDPAKAGGIYTAAKIPPMQGANGEWWFEVINWLEAAREARDRYVMITLGASYGAQAVGAHRALQIVNPMPCKLVAVEPVPENYLWVRKHFRDNGIDPDAHWLVPAAISNVNDPVFFPIGAPGSGANNCMATDTPAERKILVEELIKQGKASDTLRNLMLHNTTGVMRDLLPEKGLAGEVELISAITLRDLLSPFDMVDFLEADIQQSEARVFPPFLDLLRKKVRRIHIGTHGADVHGLLHDAFSKHGWEIVFSYPPDGRYESELGPFELNDGVLTVRNPDV